MRGEKGESDALSTREFTVLGILCKGVGFLRKVKNGMWEGRQQGLFLMSHHVTNMRKNVTKAEETEFNHDGVGLF